MSMIISNLHSSHSVLQSLTCDFLPCSTARAFTATEPRLLRAAVGTFCDLLRLAITVLENFE